MYTRDTELRRLQSNDVNRLAETLGFDGGRKLMETIPKNWANQDTINGGTTYGSHKLNGEVKSSTVVELKYKPEQIRLMEEATRQTSGCYFAEILIQEWSTSGRKHERPTVGFLLQLLIKADLWNAADFVAEHFLNEPAPERPLEGPGAKIDTSIPTECLGDVVEYANDSIGYPDTETLNDNANCENNIDHNRDYYTKHSFFSKDFNGTAPKPPPRAQRAARQQQNILIQQQKQNTYNNPQTHKTQADNCIVTERTEGDPQAFKHQHQQNFDTTLSSIMTTFNMPEVTDLLDVNNSPHSKTLSTDNGVVNEKPILAFLEVTKSSTTMPGEVNSSRTPVVDPSSSSKISSKNVVPNHKSTNSCCDSLPLLTELNLNNVSSEAISIAAGSSNSSRRQHITSSSPNPSSHNSHCSSLSNDSFDDEDDDVADDENIYSGVNGSDAGNIDIDDLIDGNLGDNSLPYLSVFGRQSPNNDSSLTTVTCTSGDNSFELSLNDSSSTSTTDPTAQHK